MKNLLKLIVVACAMGALTFAMAQDPGPGRKAGGPQGGGRPGGERRMGMMGGRQQAVLEKLNLTADQKKKIEALRKKQAEEMRGAFAKNRPEPGQKPDPAMREKMKAARDKYEKELMAILTPDQQKKFKALMKEEMEKMRTQRGQGGPAGAGGSKKPKA